MKALQPRAGDYLTSGARVLYVERVETLAGEPRPTYWPGFVLVLRDRDSGIQRGPLPRAAREATADEVTAWKARHDAVSPPLPLEGLDPPTRVYAAPGEPLALF